MQYRRAAQAARFVSALRPGIAQGHGAVERRSVPVAHEVAVALELQVLAGLGGGEARLELRGDAFHRIRVEILDEVTPEFAISLSGSNENEYAVIVGVAVDYAIFQEEGTRHMAAHPFMRPSILAEEPDFINDMGKLGGRLI